MLIKYMSSGGKKQALEEHKTFSQICFLVIIITIGICNI